MRVEPRCETSTLRSSRRPRAAMDEQPNQPAEPTEEQLRAAYEEQLQRIHVDDVIIQTVVSLINLAARKLEDKDLAQVGQAIEGTRALLPLVEEALGPDGAQIKAALSQLQLAYARAVGPSGGAPEHRPKAKRRRPRRAPRGPGPRRAAGDCGSPGSDPGAGLLDCAPFRGAACRFALPCDARAAPARGQTTKEPLCC